MSVGRNAGERGEPLERRAVVSLENPRARGGEDSFRPLSATVSLLIIFFDEKSKQNLSTAHISLSLSLSLSLPVVCNRSAAVGTLWSPKSFGMHRR